MDLYQFQIKDAVKAARTEATKAYNQYVEEPKTSQRRGRFDLELVLLALGWLLPAGLLLSISLAHAQSSSETVSTVQNNTASVAPFIQYRSVFIQYQGFNEQPVLPWRETNDAVGKIGGWRFYAKEASQPDAADKSTEPNSDSHSEHGRKP
jgi:hypothetical protein